MEWVGCNQVKHLTLEQYSIVLKDLRELRLDLPDSEKEVIGRLIFWYVQRRSQLMLSY